MKKNKTLLETVSIIIAKVGTLALAMINMVLIARGLGVETRGAYAAILVFPQLITAFTEGGMRQSSVFFIGKCHDNLSYISSSLYIYNIIASFIGFSLCYYLMEYQGNFSLSIVMIASLIIPISLFLNGYKGVLLGLGLIKLFNHSLWYSKLIASLIIVVLYVCNEMSLLRIVMITVLTELISLLQVVYYLWRRDKLKFEYDHRFVIIMMKKGFLYSIGFFLIQANYKLDLMMLSIWSNKYELGIYAVTSQIVDVIWQVPSAVVLVLLSKVANSQGNNEELICISSRTTLFVCLTITVISLFLLSPLTNYILGREYSEVYGIFVILSPGIILCSLFKTINSYYAGKGNPKVSIVVMGLAVLVNVLMNYNLIPSLGARGAAISSSFSYIISSIVITIYFCKTQNCSLYDVVVLKYNDIKKVKIRS
ncbi:MULTISPECIES: polysaccharide biosynthesis C-terminal domain-containing protein [unclassified Vibrio]|uniref:oligosaccharide flippase family protein n=1 Tax=unclassified Vibrio TaxID=2614977 RepID=UPI0035531DC1